MGKTYAELYADAQKDGKSEPLTYDIFQFTDVDQQLIGR
ncbi:unnamed protein product, partial [marine sediment metagenome]